MRYKILLGVFLLALLGGCFHKSLKLIGEYRPLTSIALTNATAKDIKLEGKEVKVWGYLDRDNLLLDEKTPRFFLKRYMDDKTGSGVEVKLKGSKREYKELFKDIESINIDDPIKILVKGKVYIHNRPTNFTSSKGIGLRVVSAKDIKVIK